MNKNRLVSLAISAALMLALCARASAQTGPANSPSPASASPHSSPSASGKSATQPGTFPANSHAATPKSATTTPQPSATYVNCHALETHTSTAPAITIVIFNQRDKQDHVRLSDLLKQNDGVGVELRTSDGKWHKATLARLRSCFGRGLLFLAADTAQIKDRDDFLLRFPPKKS